MTSPRSFRKSAHRIGLPFNWAAKEKTHNAYSVYVYKGDTADRVQLILNAGRARARKSASRG